MNFDFTEKAALALAPSFREKYDFTDEAHYKAFAEQVWKTAEALSVRQAAAVAASSELKKGAAK